MARLNLFRKHCSSGVFFILPAMLVLGGKSAEMRAQSRMKGVSLVAPPKKPGNADVFPHILEVSADAVALMPYAYMRSGEPEVVTDAEWQWWGESYEGTAEMIRMAHENKLQVMLKPHLWIGHGDFTGHMEFETNGEWERWFSGYADYIVQYARLAEEEKVALFCMATELQRFWERRPDLFLELIRRVRVAYSGSITYAANWDEWDRFPFWGQLDQVGIDGYFPLDYHQPEASWDSLATQLEAFHEASGRPIVFTELGYRSIADNLQQPWISNTADSVDLPAQTRAYKAFFETCWHRRWLSGVFIWKWFCHDEHINGENNGFTPQNKPAEQYLKQIFSRD